MKIFLAIVLFFHCVIATPIPGLNLNFLRNDAQKLNHYERIVANLQQKVNSAITLQEINKIIVKIITKLAKIDKLQAKNLNPVLNAQEFDNLLKDSIQLVENSEVIPPRYIQEMVDDLVRIGPKNMAAARYQNRQISDTVADYSRHHEAEIVLPVAAANHAPGVESMRQNSETRGLGGTTMPVPVVNHAQGDPGSLTDAIMEAASLQYSPVMDMLKKLLNRYLQPIDFQSKQAPADTISPLKKLRHSDSSRVQLFPSSSAPITYNSIDEIRKQAKDIVANLPVESADQTKYFQTMLAKLEYTRSWDLKRAQSHLEKIWLAAKFFG